MIADGSPTQKVCHEVKHQWELTPIDYLGGRANQHWLVESRGRRLVLRGYSDEPFDDINYELEVLQRLWKLGWSVPVPVEEPILSEGRTWCLFTWLPGAPRSTADSLVEGRERGRLLAKLHDSTSHIVELGQRSGFGRSDEVICDSELVALIRLYEGIKPIEGHVMRWHLEQAQEAFERIDTSGSELIVLHGDFTQWNLLFEGENLSGIIDFEATHLNYRVADFALSWRGKHDEVIEGYHDVHKLTELDWELLVPVYWSWLFLNIKNELKRMVSGEIPPHGFEWQVKHLVRRSGLLGRRAAQYPGYHGRS